ncbi:restriction endonuclease subunit S [Streptomyces sp. NPDC006733]|uniref:restriction endonuclease subunit S n=1 Tax=Streptomyces sp. NPDC006733 TaxID=3155460 RepID=UPI0033DABD35
MSSSSVPYGWSPESLRDLIEKKFTGPSPTCEERSIASDEEWGLLKTTAVTWDGWNEAAHKVPPRRYWGNGAIEVRADDVLITKAGPRHRVGVVVHVGATRPHLMVSGKMVGLRPKKAVVLPEVLVGLLSTNEVQEYLNSRTTGMAESQTNFADEALLSTRINVPPIAEQRAIAEILNALDDQIRATQNIIEKVQRVRSATLENILLRASESATTRKLSSATSKIVDGVHHTPTYVRSGVPFVTVENLTRGPGISLTPCRYVSPQAHAIYRRRIEPLPGDVLVSKDGTLGVARLVPNDFPEASVFVSVAVLRPIVSILRSGFLRLFFDTNEFRRQLRVLSAGSGLQHIHLEHFREFLIPDLDLAQQESIVSAIALFDERLAVEKSVREKLKLQRTALVSDLLSGRVRVPQEATS